MLANIYWYIYTYQVYQPPPIAIPFALQGALLKGVQLFNERMHSRWRAEGFLDFATNRPANATAAATLGASLLYTPRQGQAVKLLQKLLALDDNRQTTKRGEGVSAVEGGGNRERQTVEDGEGEGDRRNSGGLDGQQARQHLRSRPAPFIV